MIAYPQASGVINYNAVIGDTSCEDTGFVTLLMLTVLSCYNPPVNKQLF